MAFLHAEVISLHTDVTSRLAIVSKWERKMADLCARVEPLARWEELCQ